MAGKTDELLAVEAEHGFVFGGDAETLNAPPTLSVLCSDITCSQRGKHIQLNADTVLPVTCGGCGGTLYCEHPSTSLRTHHEGTLKQPVKVLRTVCDTCGATLTRAEQPLKSIPLEEIPLHLLGGVSLNDILGSD